MVAGSPAPAAAWNVNAQRLVLSRAMDTLPKPMQKFFKDHRFEMPSLAPDGDVPPPTAEERFAVDLVASFPFQEVPYIEKEFTALYGERAVSVGRLPWLVSESYARLVEAFRSGDKVRILTEADLLGRRVARLHNPLALTGNADGQKSDQHGLAARFADKGIEALGDRLRIETGAAVFLDTPNEFAFSIVGSSYIWLDNVLYLEALAKRGRSGYDSSYYAEFQRRLGPVLSDRLSRATEAVGSYWYTAWTQAGRPPLAAASR
jgi:hypothetical protein